MKKGLSLAFSAIIILIAVAFAMPPAAEATTYLLQGVPCARQSGDVGTTSQQCGLCDLIRVVVNATNMMAGLSGVIALLMFIYAGIRMATSYINPAFVQKAKDTMKYAVMGIFLIFLAYTMVNTIIMVFYGGDPAMGPLYQITGQGGSWGVCVSKSPAASSNSGAPVSGSSH